MRSHFLILAGLILALVSGCNLPQPVSSTPAPDQVSTQVTILLTQLPTTTQPVPLATPTSAPSATATTAPTVSPTTPPTAEPATQVPTAESPAADPRKTLGDPTWNDPLDTGKNFFVYTDEHVVIEEKAGTLAMTAKKADGWHAWTLSYPDLDNFYLETTVRPLACSGKDRYGLVFRAPENNQGYILGVSCDGNFSLRKWDGKNFTALIDWSPSSAISTGQSNRVGVMAKGSQFTIYLNGIQVGQAQDNSYANGTFGFFIAASSTDSFSAQFEDVSYWTLP